MPNSKQAKPARPKPARPPRTVKTFTANIGNPYAINMVMNNPTKPVKKPRKPSERKPSTKKSISLNQVTFPEQGPQVPAQVPRIMTLNQLMHSDVSLNQAKANASRNAQFFVSAFKARKSAAKKRESAKKPKGKAI